MHLADGEVEFRPAQRGQLASRLRRWTSIDTTFGVISRISPRATPRATASSRAASSESSVFWPATRRTRTSSEDGSQRTRTTFKMRSWRGRRRRGTSAVRRNGLTLTANGAHDLVVRTGYHGRGIQVAPEGAASTATATAVSETRAPGGSGSIVAASPATIAAIGSCRCC